MHSSSFLPAAIITKISRPKSRLHHNYSAASFVSFWPSSRVIPCLFACLLTQRVWISSQHVLAKKESNWLPLRHTTNFNFSEKTLQWLFNVFRCAKKKLLRERRFTRSCIISHSSHRRTQTAISLDGSQNDLWPHEMRQRKSTLTEIELNLCLSRVRKFTHSICIPPGLVARHEDDE